MLCPHFGCTRMGKSAELSGVKDATPEAVIGMIKNELEVDALES